MKRFISWNVNGLRACLTKGWLDYFKEADADIFCLQETKLQDHQIDIEGYERTGYGEGILRCGDTTWQAFWNYAEKSGYSGTAVFSKEKPLSVSLGIGMPEHDREGRVITLEFENCYFVTVYTPNSRQELERLDYRMEWEDAFRAYLLSLDSRKPVVVTGDMNVAHEEIDLKNPKTNHSNAGFTDEERAKMTELLSAGFTDTFRHFYPDMRDIYSWWSYRFQARKNNSGWRIDYFLSSSRIDDLLIDAKIHTDIQGSDHCPVELDINL